uniref:Uncharacterized protein n=2 Tax=Palpitomonas bilix TaxID=652834 RepID=A0A7S3G9X9_9EUKA
MSDTLKSLRVDELSSLMNTNMKVAEAIQSLVGSGGDDMMGGGGGDDDEYGGGSRGGYGGGMREERGFRGMSRAEPRHAGVMRASRQGGGGDGGGAVRGGRGTLPPVSSSSVSSVGEGGHGLEKMVDDAVEAYNESQIGNQSVIAGGFEEAARREAVIAALEALEQDKGMMTDELAAHILTGRQRAVEAFSGVSDVKDPDELKQARRYADTTFSSLPAEEKGKLRAAAIRVSRCYRDSLLGF